MTEYWFELRKRLLTCLVAYLCCWILYLFNYDAIYHFLVKPMMLDHKALLVSQDITDPLTLPIQISSQLSILTIMPVVIFQVLAFIRPALYPKERRALDLVGGFAVLLFYLGVAQSFWLVEPMILSFIQGLMPKGVLYLPTVASYIAFSMDLAIAFGVAFELPLVLLMLLLFNWVSADWVREHRAWWVIGIFILAMILTPPDVYSQVILALPMCLMIELVLVIARIVKKAEKTSHI